MNRTIKFRAWDNKNKRMYYQGEPDLETIQSFFHHYNENDVLMQFTGLKDKNGKEIFEGDIINGIFNTRMIVYFSDGIFKANAIGKDKKGEVTHFGHNFNMSKIIGNIYENEELLK